MIIAQISDLHLRVDGHLLRDRIDSVAVAERCIGHLAEMSPRPDVLIVTGDLVQKGKADAYGVLRDLFDRLPMPIYVIPGNHDDTAGMRAAFGDWGYLPMSGPFLHYTVEDHPVRLIGLDTRRRKSDGGKMGRGRRHWLDGRLREQPGRPTLIYMHHPPFPSGVCYMDDPALVGARELEAVVRRHPQVERVACGHMHRAMSVRWGGTVASVAPGIAFQMALNLNPGATSAYVMEPPAVRLYVWTAEAGLIGHSSVIGDFGPTHAFHPPRAATATESDWIAPGATANIPPAPATDAPDSDVTP